MTRTNDLGRDALLPLVLRLAVPTMLAQFVSVLYSIVDRIFIGNIPEIGSIALAGVGVCGPIVTLISSFCNPGGLGGSPHVAMRMGAGDPGRGAPVAGQLLSPTRRPGRGSHRPVSPVPGAAAHALRRQRPSPSPTPTPI